MCTRTETNRTPLFLKHGKRAINTAPQVRSWLKQLRQLQQVRLGAALAAALFSTLIFIVQSLLLASLFSQWLAAAHTGKLAAIFQQSLMTHLPWLSLCLLTRPLLQWLRELLSATASTKVRARLRQLLLDRLQYLPQLAQYHSEGALSSQLLEQVDAVDGYISRYWVQLHLVIITPLLLVAATLWYSPLAAVLLLLTAPLVPLFMILLGKAAASSNRQQLAALSRLSGRFLDLVRGMKTLQHLQATDQAQRHIAAAAEDYRDRTMKVLSLAFLSSAVLEFFAALAIALVAVYLGLGLLGLLPWAKGEIPVPYQGALFILLLAPEFYAPLRQLGTDYHAKAEAEAAITELLPLLQKQGWRHPGSVPFDLKPEFPALLALEAVSVTGADGRQRLAPTSLNLPLGDSLLLQGASGSGKSTLLQLLLGQLPYQGSIHVQQQDFLQINLQDWRRNLSYLAQRPVFIRGTIADNLRLAAPDASDDQLLAALQQVHLWPLIRQLPQQLDTPLGAGGHGLSGGQLSRLALAQLVLQDAPVWLLDEPTAHLDPFSREQLHQLLGKLVQGRSLILVSHHCEGLAWVDQTLHLGNAGASHE